MHTRGRVSGVMTVLVGIALVAGCSSDPPTPEELIERWPSAAGTLEAPAERTQEHYERLLLKSFDGADSIRFYDYTGPGDLGMGPLSVLIITGEGAFSADDVFQFQCGFVDGIGKQEGDDFTDEYGGEDGLHGSGGMFSVNVDGVAVMVTSALSEKQAHEVAKALRGEDEERADGPCQASSIRIAG